MSGARLTLASIAALAAVGFARRRGSRADARLRGGAGWHGTKDPAVLRASGRVRPSGRDELYPDLSSLIAALMEHPGEAGEQARAKILCNQEQGGLIPLKGRSYLARRKPRAKDYGTPVRVRPQHPNQAWPDEDWMAWQVGSIVGLIALPGDGKGSHLRFNRPEDHNASQVAAAWRQEAPAAIGGDFLSSLRRQIDQALHLAVGGVPPKPFMGKIWLRSENALFCVLAVAAKQVMSHAESTPSGRAWLAGLTEVAPTLAYMGHLEVAR